MGKRPFSTVLLGFAGISAAKYFMRQLPEEVQYLFIGIIVVPLALMWGLHFLYHATRKPF